MDNSRNEGLNKNIVKLWKPCQLSYDMQSTPSVHRERLQKEKYGKEVINMKSEETVTYENVK